jgi:hypothetical protein
MPIARVGSAAGCVAFSARGRHAGNAPIKAASVSRQSMRVNASDIPA